MPRYPTRGLSPAQARLLRAIATWLTEEGYYPTFADLAVLVGTNKSTVHTHFHALIRKGYLEQPVQGALGYRIVGATLTLELPEDLEMELAAI